MIKLDEQVQSIINETNEIYQQGTTINGDKWTRELLDTKEVDFLGVKLTYNITKFHVDIPEEDKTFSDKDRVEYSLINTKDIDKIQEIITQTIQSQLGEECRNGSGRYVTIPLEGEIFK